MSDRGGIKSDNIRYPTPILSPVMYSGPKKAKIRTVKGAVLNLLHDIFCVFPEEIR